MSKFKIKGLPPIRLVDLLRKKKTDLKQFLSNSGIAAYATLLQKCEKMGVSPPTEEEFKEAIGGSVISSPQEGVVVLDPPDLLTETGDTTAVDEVKSVAGPPKKKKKIKIDESIYVTPIAEERYEKSDAEMGDASVIEDDLDSSISKLSTLKKSK